MKVKVKPEDFVVREEAEIELSPRSGPFAVFSLSKRQWDTFDLVDYLTRRLGVDRQDISLGGIKDRFGDTEQLVSIRVRDRRLPELREESFALELRGYSSEPVTARSVAGNRFTITVRDIDARVLGRYRQGVESAARWGFPNYYDEQRFGSARHGKGFMGKEIFLGRREKALRLYFTPSRYDDRKTRTLKTCAIEHWGRWAECLPEAFGDYRKVLEYLAAHRLAFTKALNLLDRRYVVFVLNAYQSYLFNEILAAYLLYLSERHDLTLLSRAYRHGEFLYYESLSEELAAGLREVRLPVPGYDSEFGDPTVRELAIRIFEKEGISLSELKARQLHRVDVHGIERRMLAVPKGLEITGIGEDELYPGKCKMALDFFLPRGSYATLLLKRLEAVSRPSA